MSESFAVTPPNGLGSTLPSPKYLSPFKAHQRRATVQMALYRNLFVAALADAVFVAYAHPGSKTEELCREILGWKKTVYALDSDLSANLFALGAQAAWSG